MTYEEALDLIGYGDDIVTVSEPTQRWLIAEVQDVIEHLGAEGLKGPEGDNIRAIFDRALSAGSATARWASAIGPRARRPRGGTLPTTGFP